VGVFCGGSGSSKFVSALANYGSEALEPKFIVNVGDNFWYHELYVCPDVDITTYCLSGLLDSSKGWGIVEDGFKSKASLSRFSSSGEWFSLGDLDFGVCLKRTELCKKGWTLSSITKKISLTLGAKYPVIPSTDDPVQTFVRCPIGEIHLQEFWVKNGGNLKVYDVIYRGIQKARPTSEFLDACRSTMIFCPANPVTSILPTLKLKGVWPRLAKLKVVAISPFTGDKPFSGPASGLMRALGLEATSLGVAKLYSDFLKIFFVNIDEPAEIVRAITDLGIECVKTKTKIETKEDYKAIAMELIAAS
jgi:LPPG:FO 2-phospho-L-lactate transferase